MTAPDKPTATPVNFDNIPEELRASNSWVMWRYEEKDGRWTKPPRRVGGTRASTTDPKSWTTFDVVKQTYERERGKWDGIGLVLTDGIVGIDIDHADEPDVRDAAEIVRSLFSGTYAERSPSGNGYRIFALGAAKRSGKGGPKNRIEVYDKSSPRYLTVTGDVIGVERKITAQQPTLDWLDENYITPEKPEPKAKPEREPKAERAGGASTALSDADVLKLATGARNGAKVQALLGGDDSMHDDDASAADLALVSCLAFYTQDVDQLARIWRDSGRYRTKLDRDDYIERTISEALRGQRETYSGPGAAGMGAGSREGPTEAPAANAAAYPLIWSHDAEADVDLPYIVKGVISAAELAALYSQPKAGKTFFALDLGLRVANGLPFMGRRVNGGLVFYIASEMGKRVNRRIAAWQRFHNVGREGRDRFAVIPVTVNLLNDADMARLVATIKEQIDRHGLPVLMIVDTLARSMAGGDENSAKDMGRAVDAAARLRDMFGTAVLLVHHEGKTPNGARGSSALLGAVDTMIRIEAPEQGMARVAELEWVRDGEAGQQIPFRLQPVDLGIDADGDMQTTCVAVEADASSIPAGTRKDPLAAGAKICLDALRAAIADHRGDPKRPHRTPGAADCVTLDVWRQRHLHMQADKNPASVGKAFLRDSKTLQAKGYVMVSGEIAWLV